jgi:hypothetical protein
MSIRLVLLPTQTNRYGKTNTDTPQWQKVDTAFFRRKDVHPNLAPELPT